MLVIGVFLLFAFQGKEPHAGCIPAAGRAVPDVLCCPFIPRRFQPEFPIFDSLLLKFHVLTTLLGYAAWSITFAASVSYLYLDRKKQASPGLFDRMAYRAAFFAFCFLTAGQHHRRHVGQTAYLANCGSGSQGNLVIHHLADLPGLSARPLHAGLEGPACSHTGNRWISWPCCIHLRRGRFPAAPNSRYTVLNHVMADLIR